MPKIRRTSQSLRNVRLRMGIYRIGKMLKSLMIGRSVIASRHWIHGTVRYRFLWRVYTLRKWWFYESGHVLKLNTPKSDSSNKTKCTYTSIRWRIIIRPNITGRNSSGGRLSAKVRQIGSVDVVTVGRQMIIGRQMSVFGRAVVDITASRNSRRFRFTEEQFFVVFNQNLHHNIVEF